MTGDDFAVFDDYLATLYPYARQLVARRDGWQHNTSVWINAAGAIDPSWRQTIALAFGVNPDDDDAAAEIQWTAEKAAFLLGLCCAYEVLRSVHGGPQ
jgi:hypothetical protein